MQFRRAYLTIRTARLKHGGYFRTKPDHRWFPVQGQQYFTVSRPGFVWNGSIRLAPLLWIEVRDRLLSGWGNMLVRFCSIFTMADASGAEIDQGASLRWLAEMVWFPYGFAGDSIRWEAIDERSARGTLMRAELTPWVGLFQRLPRVRWPAYALFRRSQVDFRDGEFSYARFEVTALEYNVTERFRCRQSR